MTEAERFEPSDNCGCCISALQPHPEGDWVRYEDHYALMQQLESLTRPSSSAPVEQREAVARIIDPGVFDASRRAALEQSKEK